MQTIHHHRVERQKLAVRVDAGRTGPFRVQSSRSKERPPGTSMWNRRTLDKTPTERLATHTNMSITMYI